jgi:hypothetical protein
MNINGTLVYPTFRRVSEYGATTRSYGIRVVGVHAGNVSRIADGWWIASNAQGDGACKGSTRTAATAALLERWCARRWKKESKKS